MINKNKMAQKGYKQSPEHIRKRMLGSKKTQFKKGHTFRVKRGITHNEI
jgi:hypothetical protein